MEGETHLEKPVSWGGWQAQIQSPPCGLYLWQWHHVLLDPS